MSSDQPSAEKNLPPAARARRWTLLGAGAAALAAIGAVGAHRQAIAGPMESTAAMGAFGWGGGAGGHGGWRGGMHDADPAVAARRLDAMVSYMLAAVDATAEQRAKIAAIFRRTADELKGSRQQHMQARRQTMTLLTAPEIDRAALEKLRGEQIRLAESTSQRMLQAMIESAEVLTPEQRTQLQARWQQRRPPR
jgi:Spy/CpxP family protein refolding chaperone